MPKSVWKAVVAERMPLCQTAATGEPVELPADRSQ